MYTDKSCTWILEAYLWFQKYFSSIGHLPRIFWSSGNLLIVDYTFSLSPDVKTCIKAARGAVWRTADSRCTWAAVFRNGRYFYANKYKQWSLFVDWKTPTLAIQNVKRDSKPFQEFNRKVWSTGSPFTNIYIILYWCHVIQFQTIELFVMRASNI